jgi:hypothetical protein
MAFLLPALAAVGTFMAAPAVVGTLAVGSLAVGAYGLSESAKAGRKAASASDASAQIEAAQIEARAKSTLAEGSYNADRIGKKAREILAQRRAMAAAGNNSTTDQSEMAVQAETIREASIDQLLIMARAEDDANKDRYQAETTRRTGKSQANIMRNQTRAGSISSAASLANSASQVDWAQSFGGTTTMKKPVV